MMNVNATNPNSPTLEPETTSSPKLLPPYNVLLLNDDDHSMQFVVEVLRKVFGFSIEQAVTLMQQAHETGISVLWSGSKEVAEFKAEQISTFHEIRYADQKDLGPLGVRIEPAE
jgi:ATP-dependent Clp protease adaptor protein ClpS